VLVDAVIRVMGAKMNKDIRKQAKKIYRADSAEKIAAIAVKEAKE
jgi:hypothetical protein